MNSVVEQIKERLPITDVLSSYITLTAAGNQYKAKCPFHNERTASFSISPDRGLYYCFGCGAKGDIFTFVEQFEGVDFNGALKMLADRAGVELTNRDKKVDDLAPVYEILEKTTQRYQNELQKNNEALLYLAGRGITAETISQFRLGYAPEEWRFIANSCTSQPDQRIAVRAGLIKESEKEKGNYYDRFRGRIIFPIADSSGRVIGFSGRMFPDTPEGPKYLNSPETEVFQKSRVLYGFDKAKFHIKRAQFAILVEGQMDLLMSHQAGFRNTVATSGTAVSEQSLAEEGSAALIVLSRLAPHVFLAFDGDAAGQKALSRAALVALSLGMNPKVVPVPQGIDPADYLLQEGPEKWKALLSASQHFIVHQARAIRAAGHSPHMLVRALRESVFPYLSKVLSPIEQKLYTEAVGREIGIDAAEVAREHARFVADRPASSGTPAAHPAVSPSSEDALSPAERFVAFVSRFPDESSRALLAQVQETAFEGHAIGTLALPEERKAAAFAIIERDYGALGDAERLGIAKELAEKTVARFFDALRTSLASELRAAEAAGDESRAGALLLQLTELNKRRQPMQGQ